MKKPELKHCPFCGGEAELKFSFEHDGHVVYKTAFVECKECGCQTQRYIIDGYYGADTTENDAIDSWNSRFDPHSERDEPK